MAFPTCNPSSTSLPMQPKWRLLSNTSSLNVDFGLSFLLVRRCLISWRKMENPSSLKAIINKDEFIITEGKAGYVISYMRNIASDLLSTIKSTIKFTTSWLRTLKVVQNVARVISFNLVYLIKNLFSWLGCDTDRDGDGDWWWLKLIEDSDCEWEHHLWKKMKHEKYPGRRTHLYFLAILVI